MKVATTTLLAACLGFSGLTCKSPPKTPAPEASPAPAQPAVTAPAPSPGDDLAAKAPPAALARLGQELAGIEREPAGPERVALLCRKMDPLQLAAVVARLEMPDGADRARWADAGTMLRAAIEKARRGCRMEPKEDAAIREVRDAYEKLVTLVPEKPAGPGQPSLLTGGRSAEAVRELPEPFKDLESMLLPLLQQPEGAERSKKTCEMLQRLQVKILALRKTAPAGMARDRWDDGVMAMIGSIEELAGGCASDDSDSVELPRMYLSYLLLVEMLP